MNKLIIALLIVCISSPTIISASDPDIETNYVNNSICSYNKGASYTYYDKQNWDWNYLEYRYGIGQNDVYLDDMGYYRETSTGAYLVALGTTYTEDYYMVEFNNDEFYNGNNYMIPIKTFDVKSDIHTDSSNCYTTHDNTIIEFQVHSEMINWGGYNVLGIYEAELKDYNGTEIIKIKE